MYIKLATELFTVVVPYYVIFYYISYFVCTLGGKNASYFIFNFEKCNITHKQYEHFFAKFL